MPNPRIPLINNEIYHIVLRTVEGIELFREEKDYFRMVHDLFEFNDKNPAPSSSRSQFFRTNNNATTSEDVASLNQKNLKSKRELLVKILAFCLMPNHIHLLLKQTQEGGIVKFMQKLGGGYALYYNKKYQREGYLFQGRYKAIHIKDDNQLKTVFVYIHTNPIAILYPGWKQSGVEDAKKAIRFLEREYRWSSYPDYLGNKNFPSITSREFLLKVMEGPDGCKDFVKNWLLFKEELYDLELLGIE